MSTSSHAKFRNVLDHVTRARPDSPDPEGALTAGHVLIDGRVVTNPRSQVRADASVVVKPPRALRGEDKLRAALDGFAIDVTDRECVDLGASAGGFTQGAPGARRAPGVRGGRGSRPAARRAPQPQPRREPRAHEPGDLSAIPAVHADRRRDDGPVLPVGRRRRAADRDAPVRSRRRPDRAREADVRAGSRLASRGRPVAPPCPGPGRRRRRATPRGTSSAPMPSPVTGSKGAREWLLHARRTADGRIRPSWTSAHTTRRIDWDAWNARSSWRARGRRSGSSWGRSPTSPAVELGTIAAREAMRRANVEPGPDRPDDLRARPTGRERPEHRPPGERQGRRAGRGQRLQRQHRLRLRHEGRAARRPADRARRLRGRPGRRHGEHDPRAVPAAPDAHWATGWATPTSSTRCTATGCSTRCAA